MRCRGSSVQPSAAPEVRRPAAVGAAVPAEAIGAVSAAAEISAEAVLEAVGKSMEHQFNAFIDDVKATHGANLASIVLYGSAAAGDFIPKHSDYNILIALKKITPDDLRNAHACIREWHRMGHPVPVYFTVSELQNSADVFPIEFNQMSKARKVLYGTDVLAGLNISVEFLRHQVEYELRSKLILLRRHYIPASATEDGLKSLMAESLASFSTLFGAVLMLHGVEPPVIKRQITALTVERLQLDGAVFERIFNIRQDNYAGKTDVVSLNRLFGEYMEQIEKVIDAVDAVSRS